MKLTDRTIKKIPPGPDKGRQHFDDEVKGFFLVSYPTRKTFHVRVTLQSGRRRTFELGECGTEITPAAARDRANDYRAKARQGIDPGAERDRARALPTWREWVETYVSRIKKTHRTHAEVKRYLDLTLPKWGPMKLHEITTADVSKLRDAQKGAAAPNRFRAHVAGCFSAAVREGYLSDNPAHKVSTLPEPLPRERVPTDAEAKTISEAINREVDEDLRILFTTLLLTGCRASEVRLIKWDNVNLDERFFLIPKAKNGRPRKVALGPLAEMIGRLPRRGPYVFPSRVRERRGVPAPDRDEKPRHDLEAPWRRILKRAGLDASGIRLHDLRRLSSVDLSRLFGTRVAADMLGHDEEIARKHYSSPDVERDNAHLETRMADLLGRIERVGA